MKITMEFEYPEDEDAVRHALKGTHAIHGLMAVRMAIRAWEKHDGLNPKDLIYKIQEIVFDALKECQEE